MDRVGHAVESAAKPPERTSSVWYVIGGALVVASIVTGLIVLRSLFDFSSIERMQRFHGPGSFEVTLPEGASMIFLEQGPAPADCSIAGAELDTPLGTTAYSTESYEGRSILEIDAPRAGTYTLSCAGTQPFAIAVGPTLFRGLWLGLVALGVFVLGGTIIGIVIGKRYKQRLATSLKPLKL
jgi:hypothetical protein